MFGRSFRKSVQCQVCKMACRAASTKKIDSLVTQSINRQPTDNSEDGRSDDINDVGGNSSHTVHSGATVKYFGTGVSIDNFILRVEALAIQTLIGNFIVLCKNDSVLLEGKFGQMRDI